MDKMIYILVLLIFLVQLSGCGSDATANDYESLGVSISYENSSGIQIDVLHQKTEVVDNMETYNILLASIPSMSGDIPPFNETSETLISVISDSVSCVFTPVLLGVFESEVSITVKIVNQRSDNLEGSACNPLPYDFYAYNLIKIAKTNKPISVLIENESF